MKLERFYGKNVRILADNRKVYEGFVGDYCDPEDNENGEESIIVDLKNGRPTEFYGKEIVSITEIS